MRFLLLCPVALLLLTAQATTTPTASPDGESESPTTELSSTEPEKPEAVKLSEAQAELESEKNRNEILKEALEASESKRKQQLDKCKAIADKLQTTRHKLREAQDKHNTEVPAGHNEPSGWEPDKFLEEEVEPQLDEWNVEVEPSFEKKFENLFQEIRLTVRRHMKLGSDRPSDYHYYRRSKSKY